MKIDSLISSMKNNVPQIATANSAEIMAALIEDDKPLSGLARAALLLKDYPDTFIQLVDNFNRFDLLPRTSAHTTLFYVALHQRNSAFVTKFVAAIAKDTLNNFLNFHDDSGWSGLHVLVAYQQRDAINIAWNTSPKQCTQLISDQTKTGTTPLHLAFARKGLADLNLTTISLVNPHSLNHALLLEDNYGGTPLHTAANTQPDFVFLALLEQASLVAVEAAYKPLSPKEDNRTLLHLTAVCQDETACINLLEKSDPKVVSQAVLVNAIKSNQIKSAGEIHSTVFHLLAKYQGLRALRALLKKASPDSIQNSLNSQTDNAKLIMK